MKKWILTLGIVAALGVAGWAVAASTQSEARSAGCQCGPSCPCGADCQCGK